MEKQLLATVVVFLFCVLYTVAIVAQNKGVAGDAKRSTDVNVLIETETRTQIQKLGFGRRIDVKLKDGSKASGRITGVANDRFVVTDTKGVAMPIAYTEVSRITKQKEKLGLFDRPWMGVMFTAAGAGTLIVLALALFD
jgi:predicted homoserine dehydrogenase-like protein